MKSNCPEGKQTFSLFCVSPFYVFSKQNWNKCKFTLFYWGSGGVWGKKKKCFKGFTFQEKYFSKAELLKQRLKGASFPSILFTEPYLKCCITDFSFIFLSNLLFPITNLSLVKTSPFLFLNFSVVFPLKLRRSFQFL